MAVGMFGADVDEIRPGLFLGSVRFESGPLTRLQKRGITHVVQVGWYMESTHAHSLQYLCIRVQDDDREELVGLIKQRSVLPFMDAAIAKGGAVLVHCQMGMSRSATVVVAYLMWNESLTFRRALADVLSRRPIVQPNPGFCDQLLHLEQCGGIGAYEPPLPKVYQRHEMLAREQRWLQLMDELRPGGCNTAATNRSPPQRKPATRSTDGSAVPRPRGGAWRRLQQRLRRVLGGQREG